MPSDLSLKDSKALRTTFLLFVFFIFWRIILFILPATPNDEFNALSFTWGATYQIVALIGAIYGFMTARSWGGRKSIIGRAILFFAFGLFFQCFGQAVSSYFVYTTGDIPYPSLGDIGFFGGIPLYTFGIILLAKSSGVSISLKSFLRKIQAVMIPLIFLILSYKILLGGYEIDWSQPIRLILDFGYPLGQAFYVSIAILTYLLSRNVLGGMMRKPILFFIMALAGQYLSDFTFLYQAYRGLYVPEGINDLMYLFAYFLMSISLIQLRIVFNKIRDARN